MKKAVGVLLLLLSLVFPGEATADESTATPESWFQSSAPSVARSNAPNVLTDLDSKQVASLEIGTPLHVTAFTDRVGTRTETTIWVAAITVNGEPVGTLATDFQSGKSTKEVMTASTDFATIVQDTPEGSIIMLDTSLAGNDDFGGWFLVDSTGMVTPADPVARSVLAGSVTLQQYQDSRSGLQAGNRQVQADDQTVEAPAKESGGAVRVAIIVVVILLVVVGLIVWLRRELDEPHPDDEPSDPHPSHVLRRGNEVRILEVPPDKTGRDTGIIPRVNLPMHESDTHEHPDH